MKFIAIPVDDEFEEGDCEHCPLVNFANYVDCSKCCEVVVDTNFLRKLP